MRNRKFAISFGLHFTVDNISQDIELAQMLCFKVAQKIWCTIKAPCLTPFQSLYMCSPVRTSGELPRGR